MSDFFALDADEQAARLTVLAEQALAAWGVADCQPRLIKYRENAVFEVTAPGGGRAALRVHRQGYHSDESLRSELTWMAMLSDSGIAVPKPILTTEGNAVFRATSESVPGTWNADMLSWLSGRELGEIGKPLDIAPENLAKVFGEIGRTAARLHNVTVAWPAQNSMVRHAWDDDGLLGDDPLWGRFWELAALSEEQAELMQKIRVVAAKDLRVHGHSSQSYGLIHADLVPENVMLAGDKVQLIDFDDAGFGWHMFELATALFWLQQEPDFATIESALFKGYTEERPLSQADLDALPLFMVLRGLTYLGWVHTRQNTEMARELTPLFVEIVCEIASNYLAEIHKTSV